MYKKTLEGLIERKRKLIVCFGRKKTHSFWQKKEHSNQKVFDIIHNY
jgi:hypothetical protein